MHTICLPDGTAHDQISQAFPAVFAYWKQSITGGGKAWERGLLMLLCNQ